MLGEPRGSGVGTAIGSAIGTIALGFVLGAGQGCTASTLEHEACESDADCAETVGGAHRCSSDGYCRVRANPPARCEGDIHVRLLVDLTGPDAERGIPYFKGELDRIRQINLEGGIRGCPIVAVAGDAQSDPATAREIHTGWLADPTWGDVVTVFSFSQGTVAELGADLAAGEVALVSARTAGEHLAPGPLEVGADLVTVDADFEFALSRGTRTSPGYPRSFSATSDDSTSGRLGMAFLATQRPNKVGFVGCDDTECVAPLAATASQASVEQGLRIGRTLSLDSTADDAAVGAAVFAYFEEELAQRAADPTYTPVDWVWVGTDARLAQASLAGLGRVRSELGWPVRALVGYRAFDESLARGCAGDCSYMYGVSPVAAYDDDDEDLERLREIHDAWRADDAIGMDGNPAEVDEDGDPLAFHTMRYVHGSLSILLWQRAVEHVVDFHQALDAPAIARALESDEPLELEGLTSPVALSAVDHRPQSSARVYRARADGTLGLVAEDVSLALQERWLGW